MIYPLLVTALQPVIYSKTCLKRTLSKRPKLFFKFNYPLMQVKSIAESSKGSILQYFRPSFSYPLSLRSLFCLFLSGRLRHFFLLYWYFKQQITASPNLFIIFLFLKQSHVVSAQRSHHIKTILLGIQNI